MAKITRDEAIAMATTAFDAIKKIGFAVNKDRIQAKESDDGIAVWYVRLSIRKPKGLDIPCPIYWDVIEDEKRAKNIELGPGTMAFIKMAVYIDESRWKYVDVTIFYDWVDVDACYEKV